jgi:hypothetical protein
MTATARIAGSLTRALPAALAARLLLMWLLWLASSLPRRLLHPARRASMARRATARVARSLTRVTPAALAARKLQKVW